jgi:hypothetical protein
MMKHQLDQVEAAAATTAGLTALDGVASTMMVSHYSKQEAWSHKSVLDKHENTNKENSRNREPGCIYTIEYWMWLNTIEYANSESSSLFLNKPSVERQLCIVNQSFAVVKKQQWGDQTNKFRSTPSRDFEVTLVGVVAHPIKTHVDGFRLLLFYGTIDDVIGGRVVCLQQRHRVYVAQFGESCA